MTALFRTKLLVVFAFQLLKGDNTSPSVQNILLNKSSLETEGLLALVSGNNSTSVKIWTNIIPKLCLEAVKIGWRDPASPDAAFIEFFVQAEPSRLHEADTDPEKFSFTISRKITLTLYIDLVSPFILVPLLN